MHALERGRKRKIKEDCLSRLLHLKEGVPLEIFRIYQSDERKIEKEIMVIITTEEAKKKKKEGKQNFQDSVQSDLLFIYSELSVKAVTKHTEINNDIDYCKKKSVINRLAFL